MGLEKCWMCSRIVKDPFCYFDSIFRLLEPMGSLNSRLDSHSSDQSFEFLEIRSFIRLIWRRKANCLVIVHWDSLSPFTLCAFLNLFMDILVITTFYFHLKVSINLKKVILEVICCKLIETEPPNARLGPNRRQRKKVLSRPILSSETDGIMQKSVLI